MARNFTPKVITASRLLEGDAVYLTVDDRWSPDLREAETITDEADAQLRLLTAESQTGVVVGVYMADMRPGPDGPEPIHFREDFRRKGPSNLCHGKQAQGRRQARA